MLFIKSLVVFLILTGTAGAISFVEGPAPGMPGEEGSCFQICPPRPGSQFTQCVNWWEGANGGYGSTTGYFQCASMCRYFDSDPYPAGVFDGRWAVSTCAPNAGCNNQQFVKTDPRTFGPSDNGCWTP